MLDKDQMKCKANGKSSEYLTVSEAATDRGRWQAVILCLPERPCGKPVLVCFGVRWAELFFLAKPFGPLSLLVAAF